MNFGQGAGRLVVGDARVSPLRDGLCTIGLGGNGHDLVKSPANVRSTRVSNFVKACLVSGTSSPAYPHVVGLVSAGPGGRQRRALLATGGPCRNFRVPDVRMNAVGTTSNGASLCCHLVGPTSFSPTGGCPTVICMCNNPRTRVVAGN